MVNLIRRFQQPLMIIVTFLIIIAFVWLYNTTSRVGGVGTDRIGTIYGRDVTQAEFVRVGKRFEIAQSLGMYDMLQDMVGGARSMDQATENFVWNTMVLRRETERMGIRPTDQEVEEFVKQMPVFQANGQYDSTRFVNFTQNVLSPRGFTDDQFFDMIRDSLKLQRVKELLATTMAPADSDVRSIYEQRNQKTDVSVIRLTLSDFLNNVQLTDEDLKKAFEERKATFNTDEKRKVKFVAFALPKDDKAPTGKERIAAMEKLADRASEFAVEMTEKSANFEELAKKMEVPVQETPEFTLNTPPAELGGSPDATQAAFRLTKEAPNSDPILVENENGYYVMQLADVVPSRPLTFEEAKPQLESKLKNERAREAMDLRGKELRTKIETTLKAGKSFADAAKEAGATVETFPTFSLAEPKYDQPDARQVISTAAQLQTGELSEFVTTGAGGLLVYVTNRHPVDDKAFEIERLQIAQSLSQGYREALFQEWMKNRRAEAGAQIARG